MVKSQVFAVVVPFVKRLPWQQDVRHWLFDSSCTRVVVLMKVNRFQCWLAYTLLCILIIEYFCLYYIQFYFIKSGIIITHYLVSSKVIYILKFNILLLKNDKFADILSLF